MNENSKLVITIDKNGINVKGNAENEYDKKHLIRLLVLHASILQKQVEIESMTNHFVGEIK